MTAYIPIYAQYYDDKNNIITKEISYKESPTLEPIEIGIHVTIDDFDSNIKIRFFDSKIKMASRMVQDWANSNNIRVNFASFIFTTDAHSEWWTFQPQDESQTLSIYKKRGIGIIIRDENLPWINKTVNNKKFTSQLIPY
jgi:hypothetical protein